MNIAITGEGIISAIGTNKEEVLQSLLAHKSGIKEMQFLQSVHHELPVGEVALSNEQMKKRLGIPEKQLMSRTELMGILAIRQALEDAGIDLSSVSASNKKIVLVSGTTVGGMDLTEQSFNPLYEQFQSQQETKVEELAFLNHHDGGNCTQKIADYFRNESATGQSGFDELTTISTACSSAANAIMLGAKLLETGEADIVVAGGSEALSRFHLNGFNSLMILDKKRCRPFDATRAGLNLGEGAAFVVLESESAARHQGKTPHAYLTGYGNACDAYHQTASSENGEGAFLAMKEALNMAHIEPEDIQYVNAHGTGTPNNDQSESESLKRLFGRKMPWISSTKSFTGHTTSASGSIEAIICLLAMQHHFIPANLGWEKQMENSIIPCTGIENVRLENVLCNSFGFGGNDSSLIFSNYGYVVLYVQAFCIDQVVNSRRRSVQFFIISKKYQEIGKRINTDADRGVTVVDASGFYSGQQVKMLFVLAKQRQSQTIFRLIEEIDPHAFVSQSAVIGVYGEGFDQIKGKIKKKGEEGKEEEIEGK